MFILNAEKLKQIKDKIITDFLISLVVYFLSFTFALFVSANLCDFLTWDIKLIRVAGIGSIIFSLLFPIKTRKN